MHARRAAVEQTGSQREGGKGGGGQVVRTYCTRPPANRPPEIGADGPASWWRRAAESSPRVGGNRSEATVGTGGGAAAGFGEGVPHGQRAPVEVRAEERYDGGVGLVVRAHHDLPAAAALSLRGVGFD